MATDNTQALFEQAVEENTPEAKFGREFNAALDRDEARLETGDLQPQEGSKASEFLKKPVTTTAKFAAEYGPLAIRNVAEGTIRAFNETRRTMTAASLNKFGVDFDTGMALVDAADSEIDEAFPEIAQFVDSIGPNTVGSKAVQDMAQFLVPFAGHLKVLNGLTKATTFTQKGLNAVGSDMLTAFSAIEEDYGRFAEVAQQMGIQNELIRFLADQDDESGFNERIKNVVDNQIVSSTFAAAATAMKGASTIVRRVKAGELTLDDVFMLAPKDSK